MAELYMLRPLFPGASEADQLLKISSILGTPSVQQWPDGHRLATVLGIRFPQCVQVPLTSVIRNATVDGIRLMEALLIWDPLKRVGAASALSHPYFATDLKVQEDWTMPSPKVARQSVASAPVGLTSIPTREYPSLDMLLERRAPAGNLQSRVKPSLAEALPRPSELGRSGTGRIASLLDTSRKTWDSRDPLLPPPAPKELVIGPSPLARSYFSNNARNLFL